MMQDNKMEVFFEKYCELCKYKDTDETKDPCNDCLAYGYNVNSHKPTRFKPDKKLEEANSKKK